MMNNYETKMEQKDDVKSQKKKPKKTRSFYAYNEEKILKKGDDIAIDKRKQANVMKTYIELNDKRRIKVDLAKYIIHLRMEFDYDVYNGTGIIINIKNNTVYILTVGHNIAEYDIYNNEVSMVHEKQCYINGKWYKANKNYKYKPNKWDPKYDLGLIEVNIDDDFMFYNIFPKLISVDNVNVDNNKCMIYGYPGDLNDDKKDDELWDMYGMNGTYNIVLNSNKELLSYTNIDSAGGQSGSAIFTYNNNIIGVHHGGKKK